MTLQDICFIVIIICALFLFACIFAKSDWETALLPLKIIAVILIVCSIGVSLYYEDKTAELKLNTAIEENWSFYINGIEIEPENIYIEGYSIRYDETEKKVHLFPKRYYSFR